jgi:hypothetical protein
MYRLYIVHALKNKISTSIKFIVTFLIHTVWHVKLSGNVY